MAVNPRMLVVGLLMIAGAGLALALKPTQKIADIGKKVDLGTLIPRQIGEWKIDSSLIPIEPTPEEKALLNRVYNQTLSRTYVNPAGQRIMLSIAYSADQSDRSIDIHRPEVCYAAHGFAIRDETPGTLKTETGTLPVTRLLATRNDRIEPITYWLIVGNQATRFGLKQKLTKIRDGLAGKVPDGLLFRISSIGGDLESAYRGQEEFATALREAISKSDRARIFGHPST
jgi:EpsI family protein